jgi:hypothetical protein
MNEITVEEAVDLKVTMVTEFEYCIAKDNGIYPSDNCSIRKTCREYNHFEWIEKEYRRISTDPHSTVFPYIVVDEEGRKALATARADKKIKRMMEGK